VTRSQVSAQSDSATVYDDMEITSVGDELQRQSNYGAVTQRV
jgi:hypothetical protein